MPSKKPKLESKETKRKEIDLIEMIKANVTILEMEDAEDLDIKSIICTFFKGGDNPNCKVCHQPKYLYAGDCKDIYLENIRHKPMRVWDESFNAPKPLEIREKIPKENILNLGLQCNACHISDKCPYFKADASCSIEWGKNPPSSPKAGIQYLCNLQYDRVQRAAVIEQMEGGVPDLTLSTEMDRLAGLLQQLSDFDVFKITATQTVTAQGSANAGGESIMSKLFGNLGAVKEQPKALAQETESSSEVIDISPMATERTEIQTKKPVKVKKNKGT